MKIIDRDTLLCYLLVEKKIIGIFITGILINFSMLHNFLEKSLVKKNTENFKIFLSKINTFIVRLINNLLDT